MVERFPGLVEVAWLDGSPDDIFCPKDFAEAFAKEPTALSASHIDFQVFGGELLRLRLIWVWAWLGHVFGVSGTMKDWYSEAGGPSRLA